jgi:hypothetical protein
MKGITICTLSTAGAPTNTISTQWRPTLGSRSSGPTMIVDCSSDTELTTHRALLAMPLPGLLRWDGPKRSLGNNGRISFSGYFDEAAISSLDMRLYISMLKHNPRLREALIGQQSLFVNPAALLVDFGHPKALIDAIVSLEEVVLVSPRLALITTPHNTEQWRTIMTKQLQTDASAAITKIRFRQSRHGGRPWATPEALPTQIQRAKCRAAKAPATAIERDRRELRSTLRVSNISTGRPEDVIDLILEQMSAVIGMPLRRSNGTRSPKPYDCQPTRDAFGKWTGAIQFECANSGELKAVYEAMHGSSIEMNGVCSIVEIENLFNDLAPTGLSSPGPMPAPSSTDQAPLSTTHPLHNAMRATGVG